MQPLIAADNTLLLWTFLMLAAAAAIVIEQKARWAVKIPGAVIALLIALAASNLGLVPVDAPVYDAVWGYIVPLAIPLLLFQLDLHAVFKESRRLLFLFLLSSAGTVVGTLLAFLMLRHHIPELDKIAGMISASYSGGGVNFAAMAAKLQPSDSMKAATIVADNLMMACYFLILIGLAASPLVRRVWGQRHSDTSSVAAEGENQAAAFWRAKDISLQNIALSLGAAMLLVAVSFTLSKYLKGILGSGENILTDMLIGLVTDKYLLLTTLTFAAIALFPRGMAKLNGSQELGTYGIYLFFVVIGIPASIPLILQNAPLLFIFTLTVAVVNLLVTLIAGKLFKYSIEEITLACNANIGGPTTAAALAIGQGWRSLVGPILVIGTVGYIIGNYIGSMVYTVVSNL
ncbi:DUF819 domain-containing protein [Neisseria shayeganii]|uniref:DUF819 domain-containing protein n=1 Tax=Neisseria shayeganii TaxID=607712 RepID=A0A7D7NC84_9NEIS|nr:DUF819 family protein [Neisseria shayeganii]QMT41155.1 DUF819 domain-containing protein [Neisseria shayeganii]